MKQIVFLLFTLSGIYTASAQNDVSVSIIADNVKTADPVLTANKTGSNKKDSNLLKKIPAVKILTNPVKHKLQVAVNDFDPGMLQLLILDAKANVLRNDSRMVYSSSELITVMFSLPAGMYVVMLKQKEKLVSKKFVVTQ
jgi:hypothetical protein